MNKVLFLSFSQIVSDYKRMMHVDFARIKEYYTNFCINYEDVDFAYIDKKGVFFGDINIDSDLNKYDFVFVYHEETIERIYRNYAKERMIKFLRRRPCFIQLDCSIWSWTQDLDIILSFVGVGIAHPYSYFKITHDNKYLIHNACIERKKYVKTDQNNKMVYIGRIKKIVHKLDRISNLITKNIDLYTFDAEDAKRLEKNKTINMNGTLEYSNIYDGLVDCSYGLCFFDNQSPCGKIWDYLSHGLPVLVEEGVGESSIITQDRLGIIFKLEELKDDHLMVEFDNKKIFDHINANHLWKNRVERWVYIINKVIGK